MSVSELDHYDTRLGGKLVPLETDVLSAFQPVPAPAARLSSCVNPKRVKDTLDG